MQKWEYLVAYPIVSDFNFGKVHLYFINNENVLLKEILFYDYINQLGQDGWELISNGNDHYVFKRPIV